jgi:aryl-alcohol dehydrogenase-like predicted oxidoreductase
MKQQAPTLLLGTAMWGWTIPRDRCWKILDQFYADGFRQVDTATNYPINKNPEDFRRAETILQEWTQAHGISDLEVMIKVGSVNNMRTPEHILSKSFLWMNWEHYQHSFGDNLHTLMIHWDNREDATEISETMDALLHIQQHGYRVGLSGIKHPEIYAQLLSQYPLDPVIQIKHNLLASDYDRYRAFQGKPRFITYGINAGGIKLSAEYHADNSLSVRGGAQDTHHLLASKVQRIFSEVNRTDRPLLHSFNQAGMIYAYHSPDVAGILTGPSRPEQWEATQQFFEYLQDGIYTEVYDRLKPLA